MEEQRCQRVPDFAPPSAYYDDSNTYQKRAEYEEEDIPYHETAYKKKKKKKKKRSKKSALITNVSKRISSIRKQIETHDEDIHVRNIPLPPGNNSAESSDEEDLIIGPPLPHISVGQESGYMTHQNQQTTHETLQPHSGHMSYDSNTFTAKHYSSYQNELYTGGNITAHHYQYNTAHSEQPYYSWHGEHTQPVRGATQQTDNYDYSMAPSTCTVDISDHIGETPIISHASQKSKTPDSSTTQLSAPQPAHYSSAPTKTTEHDMKVPYERIHLHQVPKTLPAPPTNANMPIYPSQDSALGNTQVNQEKKWLNQYDKSFK